MLWCFFWMVAITTKNKKEEERKQGKGEEKEKGKGKEKEEEEREKKKELGGGQQLQKCETPWHHCHELPSHPSLFLKLARFGRLGGS